MFKSVVEPEPLSNNDLNMFVDRVQSTLKDLNPEIDPFVKKILMSLEDDCARLLREADQGIRTLAVLIAKSGDDDQVNRRIGRLTKISKLIEISRLSITTTLNSINARHEQLLDFKSIAVPTMLHKLSSFFQNGADNKSMSMLVDSFINLNKKD